MRLIERLRSHLFTAPVKLWHGDGLDVFRRDELLADAVDLICICGQQRVA